MLSSDDAGDGLAAWTGWRGRVRSVGGRVGRRRLVGRGIAGGRVRGSERLRGLHKVLSPFESRLRKRAPGADEDEGDHGRRDTAVERSPQHVHLDATLFQTQTLLSGPFLFLPRLLLLCPGAEPVPHGVLGALPLLRRRRQRGPDVVVRRGRNRGRGRGRSRLLQAHGCRGGQAPVRRRHRGRTRTRWQR